MAENEELHTNSTTNTESDLGSYISSNPAEVLETVLENVLCFLTSNGDRNAASLVCKSWYRAEGLTRLDLKIVNCYAVSPSQVINRFKRVTSLTIRGFLGWVSSRAGWSSSRAGWSSSDCLAHFSPWVNPMTEAYRGLEKVYLKGMFVTNHDLGVLAHSFPDLKELVLVRCEGFGASGLAIVARECRQISVFELIKSEVDANDVVDWISCFPESSSCLESFIFDVMYFPINFESLEQLVARSPSLKKLTFSYDVSVSQLHRIIVLAPQLTHLGRGWVDSYPELFARAPHIFHFRIVADQDQDQDQDQDEDQDEDEDQDQDYVNFAAHMAACKSLECLSGLRGDYVQAIVPHCANNLRTLDLSSFQSDIHVNEILHCLKLQTLRVRDSIGDRGLKAVAATCKELREFLLRDENDNSRVSEVGMLAIFKGCRKLQYIKYVGHRMTNAALLAISKNCPDLRVCILAQGRDWTKYNKRIPFDIGIRAIVKNCKKITRLKVQGLLSDSAFQDIGEYGKLLRSLSFVFNKKSDMGLKYVLDGCSKLQKLEIMNCPFDKRKVEIPFEDSPKYDRFRAALTEGLSTDSFLYDESNSMLGLRADLPHYYDMNSLLRMDYRRATGAGCAKISRLLLNRFGVEAHVMLYLLDYSALYKTRHHHSTDRGHMKIFLKR